MAKLLLLITLVRKMKGVRRIEVDYEEVLKDKENLRPVYKFLGLEPPPAGADKTVKMHPTDIPWSSRGVRPTPSRRWRQLHRLLRPPHAIDATSSAAMASTRRHAHRRSKSSLRRRQTAPRAGTTTSGARTRSRARSRAPGARAAARSRAAGRRACRWRGE